MAFLCCWDIKYVAQLCGQGASMELWDRLSEVPYLGSVVTHVFVFVCDKLASFLFKGVH